MMRIAAALIGITLILVSFLARAESDLEIKLQSAFIYRFVHYVKWNSPKWMDQNELSVSVFGDRKLFHELQLNRKSQNFEQPINISFHSNLMEVNSRIIVGKFSDTTKNSELFLINKGCECLLISYQEDGAKKGSIINFYRKGKRLAFEVNQKRAMVNNLSISSKLLSLAKIVE